MRRFSRLDMTFREAPPSVATASNKKDLRLASRRYTKTKSAGLVYDRAAHVVLFSSSGGTPHFLCPSQVLQALVQS